MQLPRQLSSLLPGDIEYTPPLVTLIAANVLTIILAIAGNWDLATVLFIYWAQSVIIGLFAAFSILFADTAALAADMNKEEAGAGQQPRYSLRSIRVYKVVMAGFFCVHYGLFHWGYYSFIVDSGLFGPVDLASPGIGASAGLFFCNHLYSWWWHERRERQGALFVTEQFITPYNRIIPMHLTIIFGGIIILILELAGIPSVLPVLVVFLALKTVIDIRMHLRKHYEADHPDEPKMFFGF